MNNKNSVSVVIPNYNGEKTLKRTIDSCLKQTLKPLEIIVCDDGSTDNSKKIVSEYSKNNVIWLQLSHSGGPAIPRNNGLKIAKGELIAFCDNDDEWLPEKLEKQVSIITKNHKIKAVCSNSYARLNDDIQKGKLIKYYKKSGIIKFYRLLQSNDIVCSSSLVNKNILEKVNGFPEENEYISFEDYVCWLKVATRTNFYFVNEPLLIYDDHPSTSIRSTKKIEDAVLRKMAFTNLSNYICASNLKIYNKKYFLYCISIYRYKNIIKKLIKNLIKKWIKK